MFVVKRDGKKQEVKFDKITSRIQRLCYGLSPHVDAIHIAMKVIEGLYDGVTTSELDNLAAEVAATLTAKHPDYALLAARISVSNLHKNTKKSFSQAIHDLYNFELISEEVYQIVQKHAEPLDAAIIYDRDFAFDYFGFKTLERSYLLKIKGQVAERPQQMLMRVAVGIHKNDIASAIATYNMMSERYFIHATPTLFNAGTLNPQMSSCFLLQVQEDSIEGIFNSLKACAKISQSAGGIGVSIHNVRATGSYIRGTNGRSNGIVPMLRVYNDTARYVDQGGGKRKGSFAIYLEPWHADIFSFLDLRKNNGKEELRTRDLFTALWIPDLFMKRVEENSSWSLFCPNEAPGLDNCWGDEFEALYTRYEQEGRARKSVKAQELWFKILESQVETGTPYMLYKDACNGKSNQQNLGTIKSSNLCAEIVEFTSPDEIAVCNLASIALSRFVTNGAFDHQKLFEVAKQVAYNLNKVIDGNYYPVVEGKRSNFKHRPIGIGVQGLADAFLQLRLPFESEGALQLNKEIFETIYFGALTASMELAKKDGPYESYPGSPISKGQLQYDLWGVQPTKRWDWAALKKEIAQHGVRNSLLIALMPTASTSQILGNTECTEPHTSNIYTRRVLSGEFIVVNKHLMNDLVRLNLWNEDMKQQILSLNGSIQAIEEIPQEIRDLYKTVFEIKQKCLIDLAASRAPFVCQSQSMNLFLEDATFSKVTSMHFYSWKQGLKTGMYYLRTKPKAEAIKFTLNETYQKKFTDLKACAIDDPTCISCSS